MFSIRHISRRTSTNGTVALIVSGNFPDSMPECLIFHREPDGSAYLTTENGRTRTVPLSTLTPQTVRRYLATTH